LEQLNEDQQMIISTEALSTNGDRNPSKIEESRFVDKVFTKPNAYF
jgi:hypothetical protein